MMVLSCIDGPVILDIPTDPCSLFLVRCMVERLTQRLDFSREEVQQLVLAVDEACSNVIRHAYKNRPGERIALTFSVRPDSLEIQIRDSAAPVNLEDFRSRELSDIRPGGLGLHFIRNAMDEVHYESPAEGGTLLRMIKLRASRDGDTKENES